MNRTEALQRLGKRVGEAQDASFDERDVLLKARRGWLADSARKTSSRALLSRGVLAYGALGGALLLAVLGGHTWLTRPLSYETEQLRVRVEGSRSVLRAEGQQGAIRFSDGTTVWLAEGAEAELSGVRQRGATVAVSHGGARVDVAHQDDGLWRFRFGPFGVRVTGTRFAGDWKDESAQFSLTLTEGSVQVSGCGMTKPTQVKAGQTLTGTCSDGHASLRFVSLPSPATTASGQPREGVAAETKDTPPVASTASPTAGVATQVPSGAVADKDSPEPTWEELARAGSFKEAYRAVDRAGFDKTCGSAGPDTLLRLADVARLAGRSDRSQHALMLVRRRYGGTGASATAAFKLGRMAADQGGSPASAGTWFRTYLREAPGGAFSREARGRLVEIERALGNRQAARQAATDYLRRYPSGPHATLARSILSK